MPDRHTEGGKSGENMGLIGGFFKYIIGTLLTVTGFVSMYIFGGTVLGTFEFASLVAQGTTTSGLVTYIIASKLPPTSIEQIIFQAITGAVIAGILWFVGMILYRIG